MIKESGIEEAKEKENRWREAVKRDYVEKKKFKSPEYKSDAGIPLKYVYSPLDIKDLKVEMPGEYPYTRGLRPLGYQYMPWMIQMLHGYGLPEDTRKRSEALMKEGMRGYGERPVFLVQLDMPTTFGYDPDDPIAHGWVGIGGASIFTPADIATLLEGYNLKNTRFAPNCRNTDIPMLAMYLAYADGRGYKMGELNGQSQNRLKTTWVCSNIPCFRPKEQLKLNIELIKFCTLNMPRWNHTNLCGYILGESYATHVQEAAFIIAEAIELAEAGIKAGLSPDQLVPRLSTQMYLGMDLFEGIAKIRASRKIWAEIFKERFECKDSRAHQLRIHVQTSGRSLTAEQPLNNIARTTLQVFACILAGVQSIHTPSYDEAISLPTEEAARTAMRINQIIQYESGVAAVSDPLGGSYYLEWLTDSVEEEMRKIIAEIESRGGFTKCLETGWLRKQMSDNMYQVNSEIESGERVIVGRNKFKSEKKEKIPRFTIEQEATEERAMENIKKWKAERDESRMKTTMSKLKAAAMRYETIEDVGGLMPAMIEAAKAKCTLGEMTGILYDVYGSVFAE
jgi:methylmalonyl-CoA mutase N-terminal domain/subunit